MCGIMCSQRGAGGGPCVEVAVYHRRGPCCRSATSFLAGHPYACRDLLYSTERNGRTERQHRSRPGHHPAPQLRRRGHRPLDGLRPGHAGVCSMILYKQIKGIARKVGVGREGGRATTGARGQPARRRRAGDGQGRRVHGRLPASPGLHPDRRGEPWAVKPFVHRPVN